MLLIHERTVGDVTVLDVEGKVLIDGRDDIPDKIRDLIKRGTRKVLLNVAGVTEWGPEILGEIVRSSTILNRGSGSLRILSPQSQTELRSLMEITKLAEGIQIFDNEEAALRSFREPGPE